MKRVFLARLREFYTRFTTKHPYLLNIFLGAGLVCALPPLGVWFLIFLILPLFYLSFEKCENPFGAPLLRRYFWRGWAFFFGYFLFGLYWMGSAFLVEGEIYIWMMPFAVTLLPAFLALFYGLAVMVWAALCHRYVVFGVGRLLLFVLGMMLADYTRGHVLTGLPWNLPGMIALAWLPLAQTAALWGVYGLGIVIWLLGLLPVIFCQNKKIAIAFTVLFLALGIAGQQRLHQAEMALATTVLSEKKPLIRIVQPNLKQKEKWQPALRAQHIQKTVALSVNKGAPVPDIIIWPETAIPALLVRDGDVRDFIQSAFRTAFRTAFRKSALSETVYLISGSVRQQWDDALARTISLNSLLLIRDGQVMAVYDKHHLVPFGEYLPYQALLEAIGLRQLTQLRGGFTSGAGPQLLRAEGLPAFAPMICYEVIFPSTSVPAERPAWLVNVTNDAWFGHTLGPWQHLAMAQMRAIEEGLPLARAANTGISAMISPYGEIQNHLPLGVAGSFDTPLPEPLQVTVYARYADLPFFIILVLLGLFAFAINMREKNVD